MVTQKPNMVLIMSDQQRQDSMGCYGNVFAVTPNLDQLAKQGARFDYCFTPFPVCTPARACTWLGVLAHKHQLVSNVYGERPSTATAYLDRLNHYQVNNAIEQLAAVKTTVFSYLSQSGYRIGYFGKWHLGVADPELFDHYDGFNSGGGHWVGRDQTIYRPNQQTDEMIRFIADAVARGERFVAINGFYPPHDPYTAPAEFYAPYRNKGIPFPHYYAGVTAVDTNVGRILAALDEYGVRDNTLVLYTSDHGENFNFRDDSKHKFTCHDESIRVPLLIRWPDGIAAGTVCESFVGLEDIAPTLLACAGIEPPDYFDGRSLLPRLTGCQEDESSYYVENRTLFNLHHQRCLRTRDWKLILTEESGSPPLEQWNPILADIGHSLYDLMNDPEEEVNLFGQRPDVVTKMAGELFLRAQAKEDALGMGLARQVLSEGDG